MAQLFSLGFIAMTRQRLKKIFLIAAVILGGYVGLYFLDTVYGGYDPYYTSDGRHRYEGSLLMHDCIMWQPEYGSYYNEYRHDALGIFFYPLIQFDHRFIHQTRSVFDEDFGKWWESLKEADIHPIYRADYKRWIAVEKKYESALTAAKASGDTNEVRRIKKLIRDESNNK